MCQKTAWKCDGENDCPKLDSTTVYEDEEGCETTYGVGTSMADLRCYHTLNYAPGFPHCQFSFQLKGCREGEWPCLDKSCIKIDRVCDLHPDCPGEEDEDEEVCRQPEWKGCRHDQFTCSKGGYIHWFCKIST